MSTCLQDPSTSSDSHVTTGHTPSRLGSKFKRPHSYSNVVATTIDDVVHPLLASDYNHTTTKDVTMETGNIAKETENIVMETTNHNKSQNEKRSSETSHVVTPPTSPSNASDQSDPLKTDALSRDVQSLLDSLRAPLSLSVTEGCGTEGHGTQQLQQRRRDSVYFRASVKRRSRKGTYTVRGRPLVEGEEPVRGRPLVEGEEKVPSDHGNHSRKCASIYIP